MYKPGVGSTIALSYGIHSDPCDKQNPMPKHYRRSTSFIGISSIVLLLVSCDSGPNDPVIDSQNVTNGPSSEINSDDGIESSSVNVSDASPDIGSQVSPDIASEVSPDNGNEVSLDIGTEVSPDIGGEVSLDNGSEVSATDGIETSSDDAIRHGKFFDNAVQGLAYSTDTQSGYTDATGQFRYLDEEEITFHIGDPFVTGNAWILGSARANKIMTPLDMASQEWIAPPVVNMLRLLQTLDSDSNIDNGIQLPVPEMHLPEGSAGVDFTMPQDEFQKIPAVMDYVSRVKPGSTAAMVDAKQAIEHFQDSLNKQMPAPSGQWTLKGMGSSVNIPDGLKATINFTDDKHYSAKASLGAIEAQVYAGYKRNGIQFVSELIRVQLNTNQQQDVASYNDANWSELTTELKSALPSQLRIALGIDARIVILPQRISIESNDRAVQLIYSKTELPDSNVAYLQIEPDYAVLNKIGENIQLNATPYAIDSSIVKNIAFAWESSNNDVIEVTSTGLLTAKGNGRAKLTVSGAGLVASVEIDVELIGNTTPDPCVAQKPESTQVGVLDENITTILQANQSDNQATVNQNNNHTVIQNGTSASACNDRR